MSLKFINDGECNRLPPANVFAAACTADDEFVLDEREFFIDMIVVELAVVAETLRRLCARREDLLSPFELRIFETGEMMVVVVEDVTWLLVEVRIGEVMMEFIE